MSTYPKKTKPQKSSISSTAATATTTTTTTSTISKTSDSAVPDVITPHSPLPLTFPPCGSFQVQTSSSSSTALSSSSSSSFVAAVTAAHGIPSVVTQQVLFVCLLVSPIVELIGVEIHGLPDVLLFVVFKNWL